MPATQRKRPQDYTGREAQRLAKERDEANARAAELSMVTAAEIEAEKDEVIDLTLPPEPEDRVPDGVEVGGVEVNQATRKVTINTDLPDTTYGHGNTRSFEAGRTYIISKDWADHLDRLGFVHH
jgi:hypothetical protein